MNSEESIKTLLDRYRDALDLFIVAKSFDRPDEMASAQDQMIALDNEIREKIENNALLSLIRDLSNYNFL